MLYGRKENNRAYLIWGVGRVAGLERESFIDRFWENHESCCRHRQVHSHSVLVENEQFVFWICWLEESRVLAKPTVLSRFSEISVQIIYKISAPCVGIWLRVGPALFTSLVPTSHLVVTWNIWPEIIVLSIFYSLLCVPLASLSSQEKISDVKTTTHEDITSWN